MISVVVYTMNDEKTISWCLSSLLKQYPATEFEVLVIDDASSDRTADIVTKDFPQFTLIKQNNAKGWIVSLRDNLLEMNGDIVAILGAHCRATENWVSTIQRLFTIDGIDAVTGSAYHDATNFWDRFHSIVMPTYFSPGPIADFLWEDNFAIRFDVLKQQPLGDSDIFVSPGAGTVVLSNLLKSSGITLHFQPPMLIEHILTTFRRLIHIWWLELSRNAISARRANPSITGAKILWSGPIAAAFITGGRLIESVIRMFRTRRTQGYSILAIGYYSILLACFMPIYFFGLTREIIFPFCQKERQNIR